MSALVPWSKALVAQESLIDYSKLSHSIALDVLRSGNHDPDGVGEYDIRVDYFTLVNSEEERKKEFKQRQKYHASGDNFGDINIPNLSYWTPEKDEKEQKKVRVEGDKIRSILSKSMQDLKKKESELTFAVRLTLVEKNVKYWFFGDDKDLLSVFYYPIPPTKYDTPIRVNQNLTMNDDNGTVVELKVIYDKPADERQTVSTQK